MKAWFHNFRDSLKKSSYYCMCFITGGVITIEFKENIPDTYLHYLTGICIGWIIIALIDTLIPMTKRDAY